MAELTPMKKQYNEIKQQYEESKAIRDAETAAERKAFNEAVEEAKAAYISESQEAYGE